VCNCAFLDFRRHGLTLESNKIVFSFNVR